MRNSNPPITNGHSDSASSATSAHDHLATQSALSDQPRPKRHAPGPVTQPIPKNQMSNHNYNQNETGGPPKKPSLLNSSGDLNASMVRPCSVQLDVLPNDPLLSASRVPNQALNRSITSSTSLNSKVSSDVFRVPQPPAHPRVAALRPSALTGSTPAREPGSGHSRRESSLSSDMRSDNDEEAERQDRRISKMEALIAASPASNSSAGQISNPLQNFTNDQLVSHYKNCIKLSAENKITSKNAFDLHLIDYMGEMLKKKELLNFQVASSTLDASAKIYAGRVDAVHQATFRVLGGLGRGDGRTDDAEAEPENEVEAEAEASGSHQGPGGEAAGDAATEREEAEKKKQKRIAKKKNVIQKNLDRIRLKAVFSRFESDPFFAQSASAFDERGSEGFMLNRLAMSSTEPFVHFLCHSSYTGFHADPNTSTSQSQVSPSQDIPSSQDSAVLPLVHQDQTSQFKRCWTSKPPLLAYDKAKTMTDLEEIEETETILPAFSEFTFTSRSCDEGIRRMFNLNEANEVCANLDTTQIGSDPLTLSQSLSSGNELLGPSQEYEAEIAAEFAYNPQRAGTALASESDADGPDFEPMDVQMNNSEAGLHDALRPDDLHIGFDREAQDLRGRRLSQNSSMAPGNDGSVVELLKILTDKPDEYSFFNQSLLMRQMQSMRLWAGPAHWRPRALLTGHLANTLDSDIKPVIVDGEVEPLIGQGRARGKKEKMPVKFASFCEDSKREEEIMKAFNKNSRVHTTLAEAAFRQKDTAAGEGGHVIPEQVRFDVSLVYKLFLNQNISVQSLLGLPGQMRDADAFEVYDYNNPRDEGYCPPLGPSLESEERGVAEGAIAEDAPGAPNLAQDAPLADHEGFGGAEEAEADAEANPFDGSMTDAHIWMAEGGLGASPPPASQDTQAMLGSQLLGVLPPASETEFEQPLAMAGGDSEHEPTLIEKPATVARIDINYEKIAKRVDVHRLKQLIYHLIQKLCEEDAQRLIAHENVDQETARKRSQCCFSAILDRLPEYLSESRARNLSVQIIFVALLHLANEQNLSLVGVPTMSDVLIGRQAQLLLESQQSRSVKVAVARAQAGASTRPPMPPLRQTRIDATFVPQGIANTSLSANPK